MKKLFGKMNFWMKWSAAVVIFLVVYVAVVYAASAPMYVLENGKTFTVISTATTTTGESAGTGAGTSYTLGAPISNFSCNVIHTGVTPTSSVVALEGSIDGTTFRTLSSTAVTTTSQFDVTGKWATTIRHNWSTLTKAAGSTTMSIKCIGQQ